MDEASFERKMKISELKLKTESFVISSLFMFFDCVKKGYSITFNQKGVHLCIIEMSYKIEHNFLNLFNLFLVD